MSNLRDFNWFSGKEGESAFCKPFHSLKNINEWNAEMPEFYQRIEKTGDDRSYVILTALVLENQYDSILRIIAPGIDRLLDKTDFGFSLKIELLRALKLIPPLILDCADNVRKIRNEFAHTLSIDNINEVKKECLEKAKCLYNKINEPYKITHDGKPIREVFHVVATGAMYGLSAYKPNLEALRHTIDDPSFVTALQQVVDGISFSQINRSWNTKE